MLKPHANTAASRACLKQLLSQKHIQVIEEGEITATEIRERGLIDVHYGSVAEKALQQQPSDMHVPTEAEKEFEECFGISWEDALKQDRVCNAVEAQSRLGWTSQELGTHWDTLKMGVGKVKFGGGFYCGRLQDIFVINGFYMAMRGQYLIPGSSVWWFKVKWQAADMSWKMFREEVVGNTDPATAAEKSLRGIFHKSWAELGLPSQPHVGENAVHGSASPFEALTEKRNWLHADYASDPFGSLLLERGVTADCIGRWQRNPVVKLDGRSQAVFDLFENMDAECCLENAGKLRANEQLQENHGFLMLKPHANTAASRACLKQLLSQKHIQVIEEGEITATEIRERGLIDVHYGSVAEKALQQQPSDMHVPTEAEKEFEECFGISWEDALKQDRVCNAVEAQSRLGWTSQELGTHWDTLKMGVGKVKFGGGFYCGRLQDIFVINGFYMAMRGQYLIPGSSVWWFKVKWQAADMSWKMFREEVVGNTDPATAAEKSLRGIFHKSWAELGLPSQPHVGENAVHGSASPFEALTEKRNWLHADYASDPFGSLLLERGVTADCIGRWQRNPVVKLDGRSQAVFDLFENMDATGCLQKAKKLCKAKEFRQENDQAPVWTIPPFSEPIMRWRMSVPKIHAR